MNGWTDEPKKETWVKPYLGPAFFDWQIDTKLNWENTLRGTSAKNGIGVIFSANFGFLAVFCPISLWFLGNLIQNFKVCHFLSQFWWEIVPYVDEPKLGIHLNSPNWFRCSDGVDCIWVAAQTSDYEFLWNFVSPIFLDLPKTGLTKTGLTLLLYNKKDF